MKLGFGALPTGVSEGTTKEATVSITDDDVPAVTASFEQGAYTVAEDSSVTVKVTLNADPERTVTIPITKANQGGASETTRACPPTSPSTHGDTEETTSTSAPPRTATTTTGRA